VAGQDTPHNMKLLFGPPSARLRLKHQDVRLQVLLNPPKDSAVGMLNQSEEYDKGCPKVSPRPASPIEHSFIGCIRKRQVELRADPLAPTGRAEVARCMGWSDDLEPWDLKPIVDTLAINTLGHNVKAKSKPLDTLNINTLRQDVKGKGKTQADPSTPASEKSLPIR